MRICTLAAARALGRAAALVGILGSAAAAQTPIVQWDSLGLKTVRAFAILPGSASDGSRDVLYAYGEVPRPGTFNGYSFEQVRRLPGQTVWREESPTGVFAPETFLVTPSGALLAGAATGPTRIDR